MLSWQDDRDEYLGSWPTEMPPMRSTLRDYSRELMTGGRRNGAPAPPPRPERPEPPEPPRGADRGRAARLLQGVGVGLALSPWFWWAAGERISVLVAVPFGVALIWLGCRLEDRTG